MNKFILLIISAFIFTIAIINLSPAAKADIPPDICNTSPNSTECINWVSPSKKRFQNDNDQKISIFIIYSAINLVIEVIVALIYLYIKRKKNYGYLRPIIAVVLANILSYPVFYFLINMTSYYGIGIMISSFLVLEIIIIFFESFIIWIANNEKIKYSQSLILSLIINASTIIIGIALNIIFYQNRL